ncbi:MAG: hypothetical protein N3B13_08435 [Deltaproteobacteria bacterium]|nr:hypothetical protein [Deltaproteobacteria bacterium]
MVNRELNKNIQSVADFVFKSLQEIEIEVLRCGGRTVYIPQTIPKSAERLAAFLNSLSGMILRMKMSMSLDKINQILSQFNQMTNDILQKNEKLKILRKEYLEISKVLESEIEATEQFLNPGNHILVNVRERFD